MNITDDDLSFNEPAEANLDNDEQAVIRDSEDEEICDEPDGIGNLDEGSLNESVVPGVVVNYVADGINHNGAERTEIDLPTGDERNVVEMMEIQENRPEMEGENQNDAHSHGSKMESSAGAREPAIETRTSTASDAKEIVGVENCVGNTRKRRETRRPLKLNDYYLK